MIVLEFAGQCKLSLKVANDLDFCSRIEHLKSQNDLLTITLEECKSNAERMSMLVGKYESNATALRLALQYRYVLTQGLSQEEGAGGDLVEVFVRVT